MFPVVHGARLIRYAKWLGNGQIISWRCAFCNNLLSIRIVNTASAYPPVCHKCGGHIGEKES